MCAIRLTKRQSASPVAATVKPLARKPEQPQEERTLRTILRAAIGLAGLLFVVLALGFLHDPAAAAARLGVGPLGPLGLATLRGDFFAFFAVGGLLSIAGAVRDDARLLLAPLLLIALTLAGRLITVAVSGFDPAMGPPMMVEAVMIVLLWFGRRAFGRP